MENEKPPFDHSIKLININEEDEERVETSIRDGRDSEDSPDYFDDNLIEESSSLNWFQRFFSPIKAGSLRGSIFSLASINFDTTCLSFPLAMSYMGLIPGTIAMIVISLISFWSLKILLQAGRKKRILHYRELIRVCLGERMVLLSDVNNFIFSMGAQTAYIVTISSFFMESLNSLFGVEETKLLKFVQMMVCMISLQIPLSLMKNISKLQYLSMIGSVVLVYTLIVMVVQSSSYYDLAIKEERSIEWFRPLNWKYLDTFSVFIFGYAPHNGLFLIYAEMNKPSLRRKTKVINRAMTLQNIMFIVIAYAGFLSLVKEVPPIFLSRPALPDVDQKDYLTTIAKVLFFFSLHGLCAINFNLMRSSIKGFFFKGREPTNYQIFYIISILFLTANFLAFVSNNVVIVIGIISGISVTFICYIFPILCYIATNEHHAFHYKNIISLTILIIMGVLGVMSTTHAMMDFITQYS